MTKKRYVTLYDQYDNKSSYTLKSGRRARHNKTALQNIATEVERKKNKTIKEMKELIGEINSIQKYGGRKLLLHWKLGKTIFEFDEFIEKNNVRVANLRDTIMRHCGITKTKIWQVKRFYLLFHEEKEVIEKYDGILSWTFIRETVANAKDFDETKMMIFQEFQKREKRGMKDL